MNREKYQVFISSPFRKLQKKRKAAIESVVNWGQIPVALENFSAHAAKDYQVSEKAIEGSQIYVLILGYTCGSMIPNSDLTYTEFEFEKAMGMGIDVLAFLEDLEEAKARIDSDDDIENKGIEKERLAKFHQRVSDKERIFYRPWRNETNFEEICSRALAELLNGEPGVSLPGWVRAREGEESFVQMALSNVFVLDMVRKINGFQKLNERCGIDVREKETLARCFRDRFLHTVIERKIDLFFESGDCPAFVAKEIGHVDRFAKMVTGSGSREGSNLYTNNILAFLELLMNDRVPVTMLPKSSPQDVYGASYGILDELLEDQRVPDYSGRELNAHALKAMEELRDGPDALPISDDREMLLICSISGMQVSEGHVVDSKYHLTDELRAQIEGCYGFHVGSFKNTVFKRYLYSTEVPILLTATRAMIDMPIDPSRCHFLFNDTYKWEDCFRKHPLGLLVGCRDSQIEETQAILEQLALQQTSFQSDGYACVIAANSAFQDKMGIDLS